ncbi:MAG: hypothetical protein V4633_15265 [Pseudomonadota bacterium]
MPTEFPLDVDAVQDLKDARLGHGFPVYTIDPRDLLMGRGDLRSMARPTAAWRSVISLQGRAIGLAAVEQNNGRWEVTSCGAAGLAKELGTAAAVHGNAPRSKLRFIRIYQATADLLEVASPHDARVRFAPLHSARQMLKAQEGGNKLLDQGELLLPLRASVRGNLNAFRRSRPLTTGRHHAKVNHARRHGRRLPADLAERVRAMAQPERAPGDPGTQPMVLGRQQQGHPE